MPKYRFSSILGKCTIEDESGYLFRQISKDKDKINERIQIEDYIEKVLKLRRLEQGSIPKKVMRVIKGRAKKGLIQFVVK